MSASIKKIFAVLCVTLVVVLGLSVIPSTSQAATKLITTGETYEQYKWSFGPKSSYIEQATVINEAGIINRVTNTISNLDSDTAIKSFDIVLRRNGKDNPIKSRYPSSDDDVNNFLTPGYNSWHNGDTFTLDESFGDTQVQSGDILWINYQFYNQTDIQSTVPIRAYKSQGSATDDGGYQWTKEESFGTYQMTAHPETYKLLSGTTAKVEVTYTFNTAGTILGLPISWQPQSGNGYSISAASNGTTAKGVKITVDNPETGESTLVYEFGADILGIVTTKGICKPVGIASSLDEENLNSAQIKDISGVSCIGSSVTKEFQENGIKVSKGSVLKIELTYSEDENNPKDYPDNDYVVGPGKLTFSFDPIFEPEPVPTQCQMNSPLNQYDENGNYLRGDDNDGAYPRTTTHTSTERMPPRELTAEERARGTSVYVTASLPQFQYRRSSRLYLQSAYDTEFQPIGESSGWIVNALAYNPNDNYLYALSQGRDGVDDDPLELNEYGNAKMSTAVNKQQALFYEDPCYPAGHLLQIDPATGEIHDLGKVTPAAGTSAQNSEGYGFQGEYGNVWGNDLWGGINVGFFDDNGDYWVSNASMSGTGALYKVDIDDVTAWTNFNFAEKPSDMNTDDRQGCTSFCAWSEDYAVLKDDGGNYAWGIVNSWLPEDFYNPNNPNSALSESQKAVRQRIYIERINLQDGTSQKWDITDLTTQSGESIPKLHQWSKAWTYGDGQLGFGTGSSGQTSDVITLRVTNPTSANPTFELTTVSPLAPDAYNTNGTSNGYDQPFKADVQTDKKFLKVENGRVYWTLNAWNNGPDGVSTLTMTDALDTSKFDSFRLESIVNNDIPYVTSLQQGIDTSVNTVMKVNFGNIPPRAINDTHPQVSVQISAKLKSGEPEECVVNTVKISGSETDPNIGNNTSISSCEEPAPKAKLEVTKVDSENHALRLTGAEFVLYPADDLGNPIYDDSRKIQLVANIDGTSFNTNELPTGTYYLIETKAPAGYQLLWHPVKFTVAVNNNAEAEISLEDSGGTIINAQTDSQDSLKLLLQVADVKTGSLPHTGGIGVAPYALVGLGLIAFAGATLRRRSVLVEA